MVKEKRVEKTGRKTKKVLVKTINKNHKGKLKPPIFQILVVIVARGFGESVRDFLKCKNIVNITSSFGYGTADSALQDLLGFNSEKDIIFSIIPINNSNLLLDGLEEKFLKSQKYAGIAFTIPLKSMTKDTMENLLSTGVI